MAIRTASSVASSATAPSHRRAAPARPSRRGSRRRAGCGPGGTARPDRPGRDRRRPRTRARSRAPDSSSRPDRSAIGPSAVQAASMPSGPSSLGDPDLAPAVVATDRRLEPERVAERERAVPQVLGATGPRATGAVGALIDSRNRRSARRCWVVLSANAPGRTGSRSSSASTSARRHVLQLEGDDRAAVGQLERRPRVVVGRHDLPIGDRPRAGQSGSGSRIATR